MKNFLFGAIAVILIGLITFVAYYLGTKNQNTEQKQIITISPTITSSITLSPTNTPEVLTISPTLKVENNQELIRAALFKKNNWPANDNVNVSISTNDGTYASGSVGGEGGGGYFFAKKVNGDWVIVADGNGVITCTQMIPFPDYPTSLIPECYDETKQDTVKR